MKAGREDLKVSLMFSNHGNIQLKMGSCTLFMATVPARVQAKAAVEVPSWLFQRLAEESAALSQAADAPAGGKKHAQRSPCNPELLALRGSAEVELAMAAQSGVHADSGERSVDVDL